MALERATYDVPGGRAFARLVAGLAAAAVGVCALWLGGIATYLLFGVAVEGPRPGVADGDPCCPHPDGWAQVIDYAVAGLWCALTTCAILGLCSALGAFAVRGRAPAWLPSLERAGAIFATYGGVTIAVGALFFVF